MKKAANAGGLSRSFAVGSDLVAERALDLAF